MVKYEIINSLVAQANKIKDVYEEIGLRGINDELSENLHTLLQDEEIIYHDISLQDYQGYLDYFLEFLEMDPNDILAFLTLDADFNPEVRIIQKFFYHQEKVSMFSDSNTFSEEFKWQYLHNYELYTNLLMYYSFFLKTHEKYELYFNESYARVLYHSPYAEVIYLKDTPIYNKEQLLKFSGLSNASSELDQEFSSEIEMICSLILEEPTDSLEKVEEEPFDFLEEPFTKLGLCMYIGALYYSIDDEELAFKLANSYKNSDIQNEKQKEMFDEIFLLVEHSFAMKRELKKKQ